MLAGKDMEEYNGDQLLLQPLYNEHRFEEPQSKYESGGQEKFLPCWGIEFQPSNP